MPLKITSHHQEFKGIKEILRKLNIHKGNPPVVTTIGLGQAKRLCPYDYWYIFS
jgi:hypothetical protein